MLKDKCSKCGKLCGGDDDDTMRDDPLCADCADKELTETFYCDYCGYNVEVAKEDGDKCPDCGHVSCLYDPR